MDKAQVLTIVVTAVISVTAKELITWLISTVKSLSVVATIREKLGTFFTKANRAILFDIGAVLFYIALLVNFARDPSPPTRLSVLLAIGLIVGVFIMAISLLFRLAKLSLERQKKRT